MLHAGVVARWLMPTEPKCAMFRAQCLGEQSGCSSWTGFQRVVHHHTAGCMPLIRYDRCLSLLRTCFYRVRTESTALQ